jgi:hypothetical protein
MGGGDGGEPDKIEEFTEALPYYYIRSYVHTYNVLQVDLSPTCM